MLFSLDDEQREKTEGERPLSLPLFISSSYSNSSFLILIVVWHL